MMNVTPSILSLAAALSLAAVLAGCAGTEDLAPLSFPVHYAFMADSSDYQVAPTCASYGALKIMDARKNRAKVGMRYSEKGGPRYDVRMEGDVEAWVRAAAKQAFTAAGIGSGGSKTVKIRIESIVTDESVYSRAAYDGTVILRADVGKFSANVKGFAENYGYAGSAENYQETVNHALDKAMANLVNDPGFRKALCR
jgi:hypothetical protein